MRSASRLARWRAVFLLGALLFPTVAIGQEAEIEGSPVSLPADESGQDASTPAAPAAPSAPPPANPASQVSVPPGVPIGPADFPAPILPGFPPPTIPAGVPIGPIAPIREERFAPAPEGAKPIELRTFLTVEEEFTDNADQTKTNRKSEFRTNVVPGVSGHLEGSRSNLDFAYAPRVVLVGNTPSDSRVDQSLTLRGGVNVMPQIRLSVAEDFTDSNDFRDVGNIGTTHTGQTPFTTNRATAEAAYTPPQGRVALAYTNVLNRNDVANPDNSLTHNVVASGDLADPRFGLGGSYTLVRALYTISSDYWAHTVEGHASRSLTPTITANLSGQFTDHIADQVQAQDYWIGRGRVGGVVTLGPSGSLSAQAGVDVFAPQNKSTSIYPSVVALWTQRFSYFAVSASYNQSFQENFQSLDNTGVSFVRSASVYLTSLTFRDLTATVGARWNWQKFEQSTTSGGPAGTKETTWDLECRLEYALARRLVLTLGYIYTIRSSTDPTAAFVENRVRLGLTYRYDIF
jgi:hypothetical protein